MFKCPHCGDPTFALKVIDVANGNKHVGVVNICEHWECPKEAYLLSETAKAKPTPKSAAAAPVAPAPKPIPKKFKRRPNATV